MGLEFKTARLEEEIDPRFLTRYRNIDGAFRKYNIRTYGDLRNYDYKKLMTLQGLGHKSMISIHLHLIGRGFNGLEGYKKKDVPGRPYIPGLYDKL